MKENSIKNERRSIEEDMKILEEMIENANIENMDMNDCFGGEHIDAIEHVLSDYKRVVEINEVLLKENEELNKNYNSLIDKIILKIDEYDYKFEKAKKQNKNDIADYYWDVIINFEKLLGGE